MGKYDSIRAEFVPGTMTLRELATAHGVSYDGLRHAAARGDWSAQRKASAERTQEALEARRLTSNAAFDEMVLEFGERFATQWHRHMFELKPKDCMYFATALEKLQKIRRTALGLPAVYTDRQPAVRVDIGALAVALGQLQQQPIVDAPKLRAIQGGV